MDTFLEPDEILRYSRQLVIPEIGVKGQKKLKEASVLIVGCGGLGSPIALYLAASGIGRIGIVDYDTIDISNLHRQVIYNTEQVGSAKVHSAKARLVSLNPHIQVDVFEETFTSRNAQEISAPYQIIIDGTDNIPTRYLMNDLCVFSGKPYVYGAIYRFSGQVGVFDASRGACYRCAFPVPPPPESVPSCAVTGVVGIVPGVIGLFQSLEVLKLILDIGTPLISKLMLCDSLDTKFNIVDIQKNIKCKVCGLHAEITSLMGYEEYCRMSILDQSVFGPTGQSIRPFELRERLKKGEPIRLIDLREPVEIEISRIPNSENVPFHLLSEKMGGWEKSTPLVLICHIGFLSSIAQRMLSDAGFKEVKNLEGGIRSWTTEIDTSLTLY